MFHLASLLVQTGLVTPCVGRGCSRVLMRVGQGAVVVAVGLSLHFGRCVVWCLRVRRGALLGAPRMRAAGRRGIPVAVCAGWPGDGAEVR